MPKQVTIENKDASTEAVEVIDYSHHEIHSGSHYLISGFETEDTAGTIIFGVTTPDTAKWSHMLFRMISTSQAEFQVHEGATIAGGSSATPINNNRNSSNTSVLTVVKDPTISVAGDLIYSQSYGAAGTGFFGTDQGGFAKRDNEIILKQDTTYTFTITSRDDDNIISYLGEWYEHTDKN